MRAIFAIAKRELFGYFATPLGWIALATVLLITGFFFGWAVDLYGEVSLQSASSPWGDPLDVDLYLVAPFFGNWAVILLFVAPAITMRLFAEDRNSGAFELLLTSPISPAQIVFGKYLGAMGFMVVMVTCTFHYPIMLLMRTTADPGVIISSYLAILTLSASFVAVGILASAHTKHQVLALLGSFAALLIFWIMGIGETAHGEGWGSFVAQASMLTHANTMARGIVQSTDIVYFITLIAFLLFATTQRISSERWR